MRSLQFFFLLATMVCSTTVLAQSNSEAPSPIHQLRIYEVPSENLQAFHERFRDHAHRIMKAHNFTIVSMWETEYEGKTEFVYLLEWENENQMKHAWEQFMANQEWKDIKAETGAIHGIFVNSIEDRMLIPTDYSPQKVLLQ